MTESLFKKIIGWLTPQAGDKSADIGKAGKLVQDKTFGTKLNEASAAQKPQETAHINIPRYRISKTKIEGANLDVSVAVPEEVWEQKKARNQAKQPFDAPGIGSLKEAAEKAASEKVGEKAGKASLFDKNVDIGDGKKGLENQAQSAANAKNHDVSEVSKSAMEVEGTTYFEEDHIKPKGHKKIDFNVELAKSAKEAAENKLDTSADVSKKVKSGEIKIDSTSAENTKVGSEKTEGIAPEVKEASPKAESSNETSKAVPNAEVKVETKSNPEVINGSDQKSSSRATEARLEAPKAGTEKLSEGIASEAKEASPKAESSAETSKAVPNAEVKAETKANSEVINGSDPKSSTQAAAESKLEVPRAGTEKPSEGIAPEAKEVSPKAESSNETIKAVPNAEVKAETKSNPEVISGSDPKSSTQAATESKAETPKVGTEKPSEGIAPEAKEASPKAESSAETSKSVPNAEVKVETKSDPEVINGSDQKSSTQAAAESKLEAPKAGTEKPSEGNAPEAKEASPKAESSAATIKAVPNAEVRAETKTSPEGLSTGSHEVELDTQTVENKSVEAAAIGKTPTEFAGSEEVEEGTSDTQKSNRQQVGRSAENVAAPTNSIEEADSKISQEVNPKPSVGSPEDNVAPLSHKPTDGVRETGNQVTSNTPQANATEIKSDSGVNSARIPNVDLASGPKSAQAAESAASAKEIKQPTSKTSEQLGSYQEINQKDSSPALQSSNQTKAEDKNPLNQSPAGSTNTPSGVEQHVPKVENTGPKGPDSDEVSTDSQNLTSPAQLDEKAVAPGQNISRPTETVKPNEVSAPAAQEKADTDFSQNGKTGDIEPEQTRSDIKAQSVASSVQQGGQDVKGSTSNSQSAPETQLGVQPTADDNANVAAFEDGDVADDSVKAAASIQTASSGTASRPENPAGPSRPEIFNEQKTQNAENQIRMDRAQGEQRATQETARLQGDSVEISDQAIRTSAKSKDAPQERQPLATENRLPNESAASQSVSAAMEVGEEFSNTGSGQNQNANPEMAPIVDPSIPETETENNAKVNFSGNLLEAMVQKDESVLPRGNGITNRFMSWVDKTQAFQQALAREGVWQKQRLVLDNGQRMTVAVRKTENAIQIQLNTGNPEIQRLLTQNLNEIRTQLEQRFDVQVEVQMQQFNQEQAGGYEQGSENSSASNGTSLTGLNEAENGDAEPENQQPSVRRFGTNQKEWTA